MPFPRCFGFSRLGLFFCSILTGPLVIATAQVTEIPTEVREKFKLDPFYQKMIELHGLPIVGSENVSDEALREAAWIVDRMIGHRPEVLQKMADNQTRLAVMAYNEYTTDVPEHRHLTPRVYWDRRARGLGATRRAPAVSCAEENLLCFPGDPYSTENILIHEFAHAIHSMGLGSLDETFDERLKKAYDRAQSLGLWKDTYAITNPAEYWAEAVQSWFDDNRDEDELHNFVNTRQELREYDPPLARLCEEVFGDRPWRYLKPTERDASDTIHLKGFDFKNSPRFRWRKEKIPDDPQVLIQTTAGDIEVVLDARQAPRTVENFLHYVHQGYYAGGSFFRSVTLDNQPDDQVRIEVIQASANPEFADQFPQPIPLERTRDTGLRHLSGTISMARDEPDSATHHFFICLGDQPELDFGGKRNADGQGFAAFGKVTRGMDVVKKIHAGRTEKQLLVEPIKIQRVIRRN